MTTLNEGALASAATIAESAQPRSGSTIVYTATYSPEDNKLRLYASQRLDKETYTRIKAAGFIWAPKQELFVAPMWTPCRARLLEELAGDIGDEDTSLCERAEIRAGRFDEYSDKRADESRAASEHVRRIADGIPMGQPILVGHHSERHARKHAEQIENGMRKAVKLWETAEYWTQRAAGALRNAKYKERPDVRQRRIKRIEADLRKQQRNVAKAQKFTKAWQTENLTRAQAIHIANYDGGYWEWEFPFKRENGEVYHTGPCSLWDALERQGIALEAVRAKALANHAATIKAAQVWIQHYEFRLTYERAMLGEQLAEKPAPQYEKGGAVQCWASPYAGRVRGWSYVQKVNKVSVTVLDNWGNGGGDFTRTIPFDKLAGTMSRAEVEAARAAGRIVDASSKRGFFLRDTAAPEPLPQPEPEAPSADIEAMRETLKAGVQVAVAAQLYPTPRELAERMALLAGVRVGHEVLEPSAGTGALIGALGAAWHANGGRLVAVEINGKLCERLAREFPLTDVRCGDFLEQTEAELGRFDRIVMNPPFADAQDIKHIRHALALLKPGGMLVAICANGPRQKVQLGALIDEHGGDWEDLPPGTFKEAGTGVNTALVTLYAPRG